MKRVNKHLIGVWKDTVKQCISEIDLEEKEEDNQA